MYVCMYVWSSHLARVRINQVRLPILLVVSLTGKMNFSLSPFAPENLISRDGFGSPVPRQPAYLHTQAESGSYLRVSSYTLRFHRDNYVVVVYLCLPMLSTCPLHALSWCGKREAQIDWSMAGSAKAAPVTGWNYLEDYTGHVPVDSRQSTPSIRSCVIR